MEIIKKYKVVLILALIVIGGVFSFFYCMYHNDIKALEGFLASYEKYDKAMSDFSIPVFAANLEGDSLNKTDDLESEAGDALAELNSKATALKLSSLIKNDAKLMDEALEINDLSGKELYRLSTYKKAKSNRDITNIDLDRLSKEFRELNNNRKTAYARFQGLGPDRKD